MRLLLFFSVILFAKPSHYGLFPKQWLASDQSVEKSSFNGLSPREERRKNQAQRTYNRLIHSYENMVRYEDKGEDWVPLFFTARLGITQGGLLGQIAGRGESGVSLTWVRKDIPHKIPLRPFFLPRRKEQIPEIQITNETINEDLNNVENKIIAKLPRVNIRRFRLRYSDFRKNFNSSIRSISDAKGEWKVSQLHWNIAVTLDGDIIPNHLAVGGEICIRLRWIRTSKDLPFRLKEKDSSLTKMIHQVEAQLNSSNYRMNSEYNLSQARVLLGKRINLGWDFLKLSHRQSIEVYFNRFPEQRDLISTYVTGPDIRTMNKIIKFFAPLNKKSKKWELWRIILNLNLGLGGRVGITSLTAVRNFSLVFDKKGL